LGILAIGGALYLFAKLEMPIPCLFYKITGLYCPGCGNTRATLALLQLDFADTLRNNLLFPLEIFYLLWVYVCSVRQYLKTGKLIYASPYPVFDWLFLTLFILWWILRNLLHI
jgi:hypothetical protein